MKPEIILYRYQFQAQDRDQLRVSLVSNSNTGNIFDTVYLTGISYAPVIDHLKNENNLYYTPKYDQVVLSPTISTSKRNISGFKLYQKKVSVLSLLQQAQINFCQVLKKVLSLTL